MDRHATVSMWRSEQFCGISFLLLLGGFRDWNSALSSSYLPYSFLWNSGEIPGASVTHQFTLLLCVLFYLAYLIQ